MSVNHCPACEAVLPASARACPDCGLEGLDQIFLSEEAYLQWRKLALEPHVNSFERIQARWAPVDSDLSSGMELVLIKTGASPLLILKRYRGADPIRIRGITQLGSGTRSSSLPSDRWLKLKTDQGTFRLDFDKEGAAARDAVRRKLKCMLPPFVGPARMNRVMDRSRVCASDCLIQLKGRCNEKGSVCSCDSVCVDSVCNGDCRADCSCDYKYCASYCGGYHCDDWDDCTLDCRNDW